MAVQTASLIVTLVDKVTAPARAVNNAIGKLNMARRANTEKLMNVQMQMMGVAGAALVVGAAIKSPIQAAVEFESAMSDVRKVVDFDTPEQFEQLGVDVIALSKELPIAATGIAAIVAAAGQAGMAGDELLDFAEMAAKVGVAFDISAAESGTALAKIKTALNLSVEDTAALADAINYLSNSMASDAPNIIQYMRRVAAQGEQYGFAAEQTAAIGSAMIAAGAEANVAATSFRNVGKALTRGTAATTSQRDAFALLGLEATDVARRMQEDAAGTLEDVLMRIRALPREMQAAALSQLFGDEARALAPLVENIGLYQQALESVSDQKNYLGSAEKEYSVRADTAANKLQILKNQANAMAIAVGDALVPSLVSLAEALEPVLAGLEAIARVNPQVVKGLVAIVGGLVGLRVATLLGKFALFFMTDAVLSVGAGILKAAGLVTRGAGLMVAGFKSLRAAPRAILALLNPLKLVRGALFAVRLAFISTGIGALVVGLALAGLWIYNNWEGLGAFFRSFGKTIMGALEPVMPVIRPIIDGAKRIVDALMALAGPLDASKGDWSRWGTAAGEAVLGMVNSVKKMFGAVGTYIADFFGGLNLENLKVGDWVNVGQRIGKSIISGLKGIGTAIWDIISAKLPVAWDIISAKLPVAWDMSVDFLVNEVPGILTWLVDTYKKVNQISFGIVAGLVAEIVTWLWDGYASGVNLSVDFAIGVVADLMNWLWDVSKRGAQVGTDFLIVEISSFLQWIYDAVLSGVEFALGIAWPEPPDWLKWLMGAGANVVGGLFGGGEPANSNVYGPQRPDGTRALGGDVAAGLTYLVGEQGPELFTPPVSGYVHTARQTAQVLSNVYRPRLPVAPALAMAGNDNAANQNAVSQTIQFNGDIIIQNPVNATPQELAQAIGAEVSLRLRGEYSDGGF